MFKIILVMGFMSWDSYVKSFMDPKSKYCSLKPQRQRNAFQLNTESNKYVNTLTTLKDLYNINVSLHHVHTDANAPAENIKPRNPFKC